MASEKRYIERRIEQAQRSSNYCLKLTRRDNTKGRHASAIQNAELAIIGFEKISQELLPAYKECLTVPTREQTQDILKIEGDTAYNIAQTYREASIASYHTGQHDQIENHLSNAIIYMRSAHTCYKKCNHPEWVLDTIYNEAIFTEDLVTALLEEGRYGSAAERVKNIIAKRLSGTKLSAFDDLSDSALFKDVLKVKADLLLQLGMAFKEQEQLENAEEALKYSWKAYTAWQAHPLFDAAKDIPGIKHSIKQHLEEIVIAHSPHSPLIDSGESSKRKREHHPDIHHSERHPRTHTSFVGSTAKDSTSKTEHLGI